MSPGVSAAHREHRGSVGHCIESIEGVVGSWNGTAWHMQWHQWAHAMGLLGICNDTSGLMQWDCLAHAMALVGSCNGMLVRTAQSVPFGAKRG